MYKCIYLLYIRVYIFFYYMHFLKFNFVTFLFSAAQSLTLTTILPGTGLRKTPNTLALIHVIMQVASKEIERAGQIFDNHKMHFAFHILRNAVHVHECRVCISKVIILITQDKVLILHCQL